MSVLLATHLSSAALAFRGYGQANLGRTPELLATPAYHRIVERRLSEASRLCAEATGRQVDLVQRVADRQEPGIEAFAEAIALVFAAELAQVDLLREVHGIEARDAKLSFGYSLGELTAVALSGLYPLEAVMRVPLELSSDCAAMAADVTMGIVFSRARAIDEGYLHRLCEEITVEGKGAIAVSAILSPNTLLVLGEHNTVDRLSDSLESQSDPPILVRKNEGVWPPLHTPLVRSKHIPDRAALMVREVARLSEKPHPPVWSLVTGKKEYEADSGREVLCRWVDSPQRLWDIVQAVLAEDVRTVIHIGPSPNVIPATFKRVADTVIRQTLAWSLSGVGMRTVQRMAQTTWLAPLLPRSGSLLRAPRVNHVVLEDWLIDNVPAAD